MRRNRNLREYRDKMLKQISSVSKTRIESMNKIMEAKKNKSGVVRTEESMQASMHKRKMKLMKQGGKKRPTKVSTVINKEQAIKFINYDSFISNKTFRIIHYIDSLGLGGAQVMTMELMNSLSLYYKNNIEFNALCSPNKKYIKDMFDSYGVTPVFCPFVDLKNYCSKNRIDAVIHHRTSNSRCLKAYLPKQVKYILVNHTWNNLNRMKSFLNCDLYISVCKFLHEKTIWHKSIHPSRRLVVLNGIENNHLQSIEPALLDGSFKTGRCHRLVAGKFQIDSLKWLHKLKYQIPNFTHYLMGDNKKAKEVCDKFDNVYYLGSVNNRQRKMSIIKALDVYFYETFQDEGASIAILESLAAGVPVLCKNKGGNSELVTNGTNGFIVKTRDEFMHKLIELSQLPMSDIKKRTTVDFNNRLHVKHTACKYVQLLDSIV